MVQELTLCFGAGLTQTSPHGHDTHLNYTEIFVSLGSIPQNMNYTMMFPWVPSHGIPASQRGLFIFVASSLEPLQQKLRPEV